MLQDFKDFVNKGNFVDIAVAFLVGAAFATVVGSFTSRIVSPLIALIFQLPDLEDVGTFGEIGEDGVVTGSVGAFLQASLNFLIVAFVMFLVVKAYNNFKARHAEPEPDSDAPAEPDDVTLLREIRDLLADGSRR